MGAQARLTVDASTPAPPVRQADYRGGTDRGPDGRVMGVTDRYLTLAGKPWIPVIGEMHYARVPEADWDAELAEMKAAGVTVVSTYVIWIYHEEVQGQWDWSGRRDLRRFAQLCRKHGLLLMVRVGPWAHAETRNGGLPDWVVKAGPTRRMDPTFMAETRVFYDRIGDQLHGLLWKDGGPVVGVQIENEYAQRGPGKGAPYILALKAMAREAGLDVPLYTVTGWDNAVVPPHEFLPVFGGYPAQPWGGTTGKLPPQEVFAFRFGSRVSGNMGMIGAGQPAGAEQAAADARATPFLTAEIGGGIEDTYARRPVVSAEDIAAMTPVMLGSGVNGYGTYMMAGGADPDGKLTTLQESQATGYPTDVPVKSYDFQAPIGEFGRERRSLRLLKEWNYFMGDFGPLLAPMPAFAPAAQPRDPADLSVLRWSVRTDGTTGFVFVNNYVRGSRMPARHGVQFSIALPGGRSAMLPKQPVDIPSGSFFAWPFGLRIGSGLELEYATAQLMARLPSDAGAGAGETDVLFCLKGIRCELSLRGKGLLVKAPAGVQVRRSPDGEVLTRAPGAGARSVITVREGDPNKSTVRLVLLDPEAAENTWKLPFAGSDRLVRTVADLQADADGLVLSQLGNPVFHFDIYPSVPAPESSNGAVTADGNGAFRAALPPVHAEISLNKIRAAGTVPPNHAGPGLPWRPIGMAEAPSDAAWSADAAEWQVNLNPGQIPSGASNLFLRFGYVGDEARLLTSGGTLLDDNFWNGQNWLVGLRPFATSAGALPQLQLHVLPMHADAPLYLPSAARAELPKGGQALNLKSVEVIPEYQLRLAAGKSRP